MCEPVSLTALGLAAAGTVAGLAAQQQQNSAMSKATDDYDQQYAAFEAANTQKQQALQAQKNDTFQNSLNNATVANQNQQKATKAADLTTQYDTASTPTNPTTTANSGVAGTLAAAAANPNNTTANQIVNSSYTDQYSKLSDYLNQQAGAKANLDANQYQTLSNDIYNSNQGNTLNLINNMGQGNNNLLQNQLGLENQIYQNNMQKAQSAGGIFSTLGSLFGAASGAVGKGAGRVPLQSSGNYLVTPDGGSGYLY